MENTIIHVFCSIATQELNTLHFHVKLNKNIFLQISKRQNKTRIMQDSLSQETEVPKFKKTDFFHVEALTAWLHNGSQVPLPLYKADCCSDCILLH